MLHTRRVLQAWVYFKRFAVSVLGVKTGGSES
jgi:CRISPR-associated protein Cmr5